MRRLFGKDEPEELSKELLNPIDFSKFMKTNAEEHHRFLEELVDVKTALQLFKTDILFKLDDISKGTPPAEDFTKELTDVKVRAVPDLIKEALSKVEAMSFSELLEATQVTAPTLSKHLSKMVADGLVERIETDRTVLYRLKRRSDG